MKDQAAFSKVRTERDGKNLKNGTGKNRIKPVFKWLANRKFRSDEREESNQLTQRVKILTSTRE